MLTLSFNFFAFVRVSVKRQLRKYKNCSLLLVGARNRAEVGRFLIRQNREESNFFLESNQEREERENFFPLPSSNFWTLIKKEERVKMAASVSWSQRWLRPEVSDSRSSSFFETTTDDTC